MFLAGILTREGIIDGGQQSRTPRLRPDERTFSYVLHEGEPEIRVTQGDVRAIQLAKGALYAGARLLMDHMGIDEVDRVVLAGAFGSHIDVKYAMVLGMIPDCTLTKVYPAGNAAGSGALIALLNQTARDDIERLIRRVEKIETAVEPQFQAHFVEAMAIPHATAPYPKLSQQVQMPAGQPAVPAPVDGRGGRRRRRRQPAPG